MRKILTVLLGALFMLSSCTKDDNGLSNDMERQFSINVNTSSDVKIRNASSVKRYTLEIWHNEMLNGVVKSTLFQRIVQSKNQFDFRLITNQSYDFLVWVDYAKDAAVNADNHYKTDATVNGKYVGLKRVELISSSAYANKDHSRDAFFGSKSIKIDMSNVKIDIECVRPFARLDIYSTDWKEVNEQNLTALKPNKVVFEFTGYTQFNVLTGLVEGEKTMYAQAPRDITTDASATEALLTCDYLFAPVTDILANGTVSPILKFYNGVNYITDYQEKLNNISIKRNHVTNVRGGLISKKGTITVDVNPKWEDTPISPNIGD